MAQNSPQQNMASLRPPVIVIMGHIDHGKSTLLDYIRKSNIVEREAGGITQHVAAYEVKHAAADGTERRITFLDTPGHAAFSSIRERGGRIADIAVLVVSAEDGVKPQTLEALEVIKDEKLPFIVAINKIDKPAADIIRTKTSLAENGIYVEGFGGSVSCVQISAKTGEGVPDLLDMMLLTADLEDFRGDPSLPASGYVLESNLDPKKGLSATLIIKNGTLKGGQFVAAGSATAPVRIMEDFQGKPLKEATFSSPVRIIGWDKLPAVGEEFKVFETKNDALEFAAAFAEQSPTSNEPLPDPESGVTVIPVIVKGDTVGSLEAIQKELAKLSTERVAVRIVQSGIGTLSENDLRNAEGIKNTVIVSFNAKIDATARAYALRQGLEIHEFNIIYKLTEWMEDIVAERTPKVLTDVLAGEAKVLKIFSKTKDRQVVGCRVESGSLKNGATVKVMRRDAEIGEGRIRELQHNKNKTSEVTEGMEFGALVEFSIDLAPADRLQAFETVEK